MQVRIQPSDPKRAPSAVTIEGRAGALLAALLLAAGTVVVVGLAGAPDLVSYVVRSAERLTLRQATARGLEAFASVQRRQAQLERRLRADALFLGRVALVIGLDLPDGFPVRSSSGEIRTPVDLELEVSRLARRLRLLEALRRRVALARVPDPERIPSLSPVEPSQAVPVAAFGPRISPLTHRPEFFPGLAVAAVRGTNVRAPADGTVVFAGPAPDGAGGAWRALGTILVLAHGERTRTVYGHLDKVLVRRGQSVRRGAPVALVGSSGWVQAPLLHYEVRKLENGRFVPEDPRISILDADWITAAELRSRPKPPADLDLPPRLR